MILNNKILKGERIYLRSMTSADASLVYASWLNDKEVNKFLATKSATVAELEEYISKKNSQSDALHLGIFLKDNDQHIGTVKLEPIDSVNKKATIAIMIGDKASWGKGFAKEAMKVLIDYALKELKIEEINLGVLLQNENAIKAYKKLGFQETRREMKSVKYPNGVFDQIWMSYKKISL